MGGAKPDMEVSASPATAWLESLRSFICSVMTCRRSAGSSMSTGSSANMAETLFSYVPSPTALPDASRGRTETGTRVRTTRSTSSSR